MELCGQGEVLIGERRVEAEGEVGVRVAQDHAVLGVDDAVLVGVDIGDVACLQGVAVVHQSVGLLVALEDTVGLVAPEQSDGLALDEDVDREGGRSVVRQVGAVVGLVELGAVLGQGQTEVGDAVLVVRQVGADGPGEVLGAHGHGIDCHLDTVVLDRAAVHVDRAVAC